MSRDRAALKEWASAVEALLEGRTVVALRKGGIREETKDFRLTSDTFYFFPTYEHQKEHLLKAPYRGYVAETKRDWRPDLPTVPIRAWAEATDELLIEDDETLRKLSPFHVWTDEYAEERLRWKRTKPLHCLLLRVYRLDGPWDVEAKAEFAGCKSWIELPDGGSEIGRKPVLSDEAYRFEVERIRSALA